MKSVLLLFAIVGLCLCAAQAATPAPTWGAAETSSAPIVKASSAPAAQTPPTVAGIVRRYLDLPARNLAHGPHNHVPLADAGPDHRGAVGKGDYAPAHGDADGRRDH